MKIGLLGQFGSGNSGNDGSLEAMLAFLRHARPDASLLCICSNPVGIRERFALETLGIRGGAPGRRPLLGQLDARLGRLPGRLISLFTILNSLGDTDVMVIPGTGILDDFQENPFGWPFIIYWWCLAARLRGTRIAFVSIGAGPIRSWLSRWFLKSAVQMADYRSYRDDYSLHYVRDLGIDISDDKRFPDIAFGLHEPVRGLPAEGSGTPATIGVGVMHYRGWERDHADGDTIYQTYVTKISGLVRRLLDAGHDVRLFMGDTADECALEDIRATVAGDPAHGARGRLSAAHTVSLQTVMEEIMKVDIAIVSRYHNLLCALKLDRPALSIGYAQKNDELMGEFGRGRYCQHIETFDVDMLIQQVRVVLTEVDAAREEIARRNAAIRARLLRQQDLLLLRVLNDYNEPSTAST